MLKPFQQSKKKEAGREYIAEEEQAIIAQMIEEMQKQLTFLYTDTKMLRQVHTKMHGCVKATFTVMPESKSQHLVSTSLTRVSIAKLKQIG